FAVRPCGRGRIEIELGRGDVNAAAIAPGSIVWKTDDPAIRRRLEHSFSRDDVVDREPLRMTLRAHVGTRLALRVADGAIEVDVEWDKPLERAQKFPLNQMLAREQLGRLGDTPFQLGD